MAECSAPFSPSPGHHQARFACQYFSYLTPFFSFSPHCGAWSQARQHPKKVVSDSLGLVDFAIRLVNSVLNQGRVVQSWVKITQG